MMHLDSPKTASVKDYLRTVDFETSEVKVYWTDEHGSWRRETFASRPDNVVVQLLIAPQGHQINARIAVEKPPARMRMFGGVGGTSEVHQDYTADRLIYKCRLDPSVDNSGYAGVVRVFRMGGSARIDGDKLVVEDASSVMLLTRIEWFADYSEGKVEALRQAVEQLSPDYDATLERQREVQSEAFNRVTVDFGGASQYGLSTEELLADQRSRPDYSPALLEKIFQMGRYWFIYTSGKYPTMVAETNANIKSPAAASACGGSVMNRRSAKPCPMLSLMRSATSPGPRSLANPPNRRVRTRMHGGVGGVSGQPTPIPNYTASALTRHF
jgi:alpha-L-fucosidase 2